MWYVNDRKKRILRHAEKIKKYAYEILALSQNENTKIAIETVYDMTQKITEIITKMG